MRRRDSRILERVRLAILLEHDWTAHQLAGIREALEDVRELASARPDSAELELINKRAERLAETVAGLLLRFPPDEPAGYSRKVPDE
jgi:hypothetical protein